MLEICLRLGVRCVTVFAFAIPNFKRSAKEVDDLMQLAEEKLLELCQHGCVAFPPSALLDSYLPIRQTVARYTWCPIECPRKDGVITFVCTGCSSESGRFDAS